MADVAGGRWHRLERYARFRSRRLSLDALPSDVMRVVVGFLSWREFLLLVHAYVGFAPDLWERGHLGLVPRDLRSLFVIRQSLSGLQRRLEVVAETALFHCRRADEVRVLVDWSPFSPHPPREVARVCWTREALPRADVRIHTDSMYDLLRRALDRGLPVVRITLHPLFYWSNRAVLHPTPCVVLNHALLPHAIVAAPPKNASCPLSCPRSSS